MQRSPFRPALVLVFCVLGLLISVAFNTTSRLAEARPSRASDLVEVVREMEQQRDELQDRLADLRAEVSRFEREAAEDAGVRESFTQELNRVRQAAGLTAVRGPGVEVVLGDASEVSSGADPNDYLIHDTDIATVVNALFVGGAEAIDVNGERVIAGTPIRCAGTTILVNATRLGDPYTIRAIGDATLLEQSVLSDESASLLFDVYQSQYGLQVSISKKNELEVAPYRGSLRPQFAKPVSGGV